MKNNRRLLKNFIINKDFQLRIIFYNFLYLFIASLITAAVILYPETSKMSSSLSVAEKYDAAQTFITLSARLIPAILILLLISFIHMLILTHKICGPIISFNKAIKEYKEGNISARVNLRKNDFLKNESREVNEIVQELESWVVSLKKDVETLEKNIDSREAEELKKDFDKIKKKLNIIKS
ncbi:MAG: hypothetical protein ACQEQS_06815 [Thermodesulfobacteriota bacterium]